VTFNLRFRKLRESVWRGSELWWRSTCQQ